MSTVDVVEQKSIFTSFQTSIPSNDTSETNQEEIAWLVVFLSCCVYFIYTFLKRKS